MANKLSVVQVTVSSLRPYGKNPKRHPDEQVALIAESISNYGFTVPLVVDGDHQVIMGHGRLLAARKLGLDRVPCIVRSDLTDSQIIALRIADNKVSESAWDIEALIAEAALTEEFTGFDEDELAGMMRALDVGENDPRAEWDGMPSFEQEKLEAHRRLIVYFATPEDVEAFIAATNLELTSSTKFAWYPVQVIQRTRGDGEFFREYRAE